MCVCVWVGGWVGGCVSRHIIPTQKSIQTRAQSQINTHPSKPLIVDFQDLVRHCAVIIGGGDVDLDAGQKIFGVIGVDNCLTAATLDVGQPGSIRPLKSINQNWTKCIYIRSASHNAIL